MEENTFSCLLSSCLMKPTESSMVSSWISNYILLSSYYRKHYQLFVKNHGFLKFAEFFKIVGKIQSVVVAIKPQRPLCCWGESR